MTASTTSGLQQKSNEDIPDPQNGLTIPRHRILLTGAGTDGSLGSYLYRKFASQGHDVLGVGRRGPHTIIDFKEAKPGLLQEIVDGYRPTVLINNAALLEMFRFQDSSPSHFQRILRVNLLVPLWLSQFFCQLALQQINGGDKRHYKIINVSSMASVMSMRNATAYVTCKAALEAMTRNLAREYSGKPLSFIGISPGVIWDSAMEKVLLDSLVENDGVRPEDVERRIHANNPMPFPTQEEVWKLFDFAVNYAPIQASGSILRLPGGMGV